MGGEQLRKLRYILNFARLADFEPGPRTSLRSQGHLGGRPSRGGPGSSTRCTHRPGSPIPSRLEGAKDVLATLVDDQDDRRRSLIEHHGGGTPRRNDAVGYKKLVTVLGGGGGAGCDLSA